MTDTLLIPLSGDAADARSIAHDLLGVHEPAVFTLAQIANGSGRALRNRDYTRLGIVGNPPADEIGYCFTLLASLAARTPRVAEIDAARSSAVERTLVRHLATSAPLAVGQIAASTVAVALQRAVLPLARRRRVDSTSDGTLRRVLYVRPSVGTGAPVGGSVTHSHEVVRALRGEGVHVEGVTTDAAIARTAAADADIGFRWRVVGGNRVFKAIPASAAFGADLSILRSSVDHARSVDVIYQRHARFSLSGALLALAARRPLFLEYNGPEEFIGRFWNPTPFLGQLVALEQAALSAAARIFVVSEVDRRSLIARGFEPGRIILNPNGVAAERFARGGGDLVRRRHGLDTAQIVVGFVGSFGPWHGAPVLARAFAQLATRLPELRLLLVGEGPELEETLATLSGAGVGERIVVVGRVAPAEVPAYLDASDVLVSPHVPLPGGVEFFGSPTKLFEYMAAGKAIVASRLGQIDDVLEHRDTAWLVEPGQPEQLAEAIEALAIDPSLRKRLGTAARVAAVERHEWRRNARAIVEAYRDYTEAGR